MLVFVLIFVALFVFTILLYGKWQILFHSFKIPGPAAVPLVGTFSLINVSKKGFINEIIKQSKTYYPVWKAWTGSELYIVTNRPTDAETVLSTFLDKSNIYKNFDEYSKGSILTAEASSWKVNRKLINPSFNLQVINSFLDAYIRYTTELVDILEKTAGTEQTDIIKYTWRTTLDNVIETLGDSEPSLHKNRYDFIVAASIFGDIFMQRTYKFWYRLHLIWKNSSLSKKHAKYCEEGRNLPRNMLTLVEESYEAKKYESNSLREKRFLPHLVKMCSETDAISPGQVLEETVTMLHAGTESTAATIAAALVFLGINPEIQDKLYDEIISVLGSTTKNPTLEDLNRLEFTERVLKETMRLVPALPVISRRINNDIKADPYVYPAGSNILIPIIYLHQDPAVWPDPKKFDPDRFLPDVSETRHRCSYIPFSYGVRNCIGLRYAMMSMKVFLAMIIQKLRVRTVEPATMDEVQWQHFIVLRIKNSRVVFEKR
ncbi:cytochrome P450 4C1-like [Zophobas morio]|uniref:cytochrome P450 4C1-like n=1 Tax=Zophobas morio TaxID=2755281 RepID=UPI0030827B0A